ncbi:MAG: hypothetical protein BMS9Abin10_0441 [Gammaproteobacteria bacterium]|nr:MAG: hypothetical protein BMS9Abin10_0441 [Gammaproteobacteria bacterium]
MNCVAYRRRTISRVSSRQTRYFDSDLPGPCPAGRLRLSTFDPVEFVLSDKTILPGAELDRARDPNGGRARDGADQSTQRSAPPGLRPQRSRLPSPTRLTQGVRRRAFLALAFLLRSKDRGSPSVANPLAGTTVHWTVVLFRLAPVPTAHARLGCASLSVLSLGSPGLAVRGEPVQRDKGPPDLCLDPLHPFRARSGPLFVFARGSA